MKSKIHFLSFFNKKRIILFFLLVALISFGITAQPFSGSNLSFQSGSLSSSAGERQTDASQPALVYSPFSPFSATPSLSSLGNNPVLFGPGGEPIGGLPLGNGSIVLLYFVIAYALFRLIHTRFRHVVERFIPVYEFFPKRQKTENREL